MHFALKASRNRLIKLEMILKDVRSNDDDGEKANQPRYRHKTTNHLSIQKSTRDKKIDFQIQSEKKLEHRVREAEWAAKIK